MDNIIRITLVVQDMVVHETASRTIGNPRSAEDDEPENLVEILALARNLGYNIRINPNRAPFIPDPQEIGVEEVHDTNDGVRMWLCSKRVRRRGSELSRLFGLLLR